jgi:hypothetical protein
MTFIRNQSHLQDSRFSIEIESDIIPAAGHKCYCQIGNLPLFGKPQHHQELSFRIPASGGGKVNTLKGQIEA